MAAEIKVKVRAQIPGGGASPANLGTVLGPHGVNMMDFCKAFNAQTAQSKGDTIPVVITIYKDRTLSFIIKTPLTSDLIKKKLSLKKGSSRPSTDKVGKLTQKDLEEIAKVKMPDLNAITIDEAKKVVAGSARSMGVDIVD